MPIRFKCPNPDCRKALRVNDKAAGKKVACPACKKPVIVPAPTGHPADLEDFAAAALAGDAPVATRSAVPAPSSRTIDFTCDYCDAPQQVSADEAGKQIQCRECKRLIKVPRLKEEKKDWRDVATRGPAFAKQDAPEKPIGAWDTTRGYVSQDALEEAGVVTVEAEPPRTVAQWIRIGASGVAVVVVILMVWGGVNAYFSRTAQERALGAALEYAEPKPKIPTLLVAEVHGGAGEFYLQRRKAEKARTYMSKARSHFLQSKADSSITPFERDLLLTRIAVRQADLGGSGDEVLSDRDTQEKLKWDDVVIELKQTLQAISSPEARAAAVREVARTLFRRNQKALAVGLANVLKSTEKDSAALEAQVIALLLGSGQQEKVDQVLADLKEKGKGTLDGQLKRLAEAEGRALEENFSEASKLAQRDLSACLAVALVALGKNRLAEAKESLEQALKAAEGKSPSPLQQYQLTRLAARTGHAKAKAIADAISNKPARGFAQLELLRADLEKKAKDGARVEMNRVEEFVKDKDTLAHALAHEAIARHNARLGYLNDVLDTVERLEERLRPLVQLGAALGEQERMK
ncbi:MAG: hypothetical protein L0Z62_08515 [Gemmataceae bacterium]|nr:hypothetical protein [Gemmataceae bacterium]